MAWIKKAISEFVKQPFWVKARSRPGSCFGSDQSAAGQHLFCRGAHTSSRQSGRVGGSAVRRKTQILIKREPVFSPGQFACKSTAVMDVRASRLPSVPVLNLLKAKCRSAKATLVTTAADLASLESGSMQPVWVFGDHALVNAVLSHEGLADVHVVELVRSDTGFWNHRSTSRARRYATSIERISAGFGRSLFHPLQLCLCLSITAWCCVQPRLSAST